MKISRSFGIPDCAWGRRRHSGVAAALLLATTLAGPISIALGQSAEAKALGAALAARDRQDLMALHRYANEAERLAASQKSASAFYNAALTRSYEAEVALELADKTKAAAAAEQGIALAEEAVKIDSKSAEKHRILGVLCGQIIPANLLMAMRYGACARDEITEALRLDPRSPEAYLGRGVGNYYLPESFGGGLTKAVQDFRYAASLNPKLPEAWLWLGLALRKQGNVKEAREALLRARSLAPKRVWIEKQIAKTPE